MKLNFAPDGRQVSAVLFDVDGTLVDSITFLVECFQHAAHESLRLQLTADVVMPLVGMSLVDMFRTVSNECDDALVERCVESYRAIYYPSVSERSPLFPDSHEVVRSLAAQGIPLGIVSGKNLVGIRRVLEPSGLLDHFDAIVGSDHGCPSKPAPDAALAAAEMLNADPIEVLMVGDSLLDVDMGNAAGMGTVGVATGTTGLEALAARATVSIENLTQLLPLMR